MKRLAFLGAAAALSVLVGTFESPLPQPPPGPEEELATVTRGEHLVRTVHDGRLESRNVVAITSRFQGSATILSLVEEGTRVAEGDLLVELDTGEIERELLRHRTDVVLSSAELAKIVEGKHPLEIGSLQDEISAVRRSLSAERRYLVDSRELAEDQLVSPVEIAEQEAKVRSLTDRLESLETELRLTREHFHPAEIDRAEATLAAAREELARAERQLAHGRILAPADGVVAYQPLHLNGEYRTVRVGDSVYANQPFLRILDFADLVVQIAVPEAELGNVREGDPVLIQPTAYPAIRLPGEVEQVGAIAQTLPDRPSWQRFFRATIGVREGHDLLRPGMSVVAQVVGYHAPDALLLPRRAVRFEGDRATAIVVDGSRREVRELTLGPAGEILFEVLAGVSEGEKVILQ